MASKDNPSAPSEHTARQAQLRIYYVSGDGTMHQAVVQTTQPIGDFSQHGARLRAAIDAYMGVMGGEAISVQLEMIGVAEAALDGAEPGEPGPGQVLQFPARDT